MIKTWWTAPELAQMDLPDVPDTAFGVRKKAQVESWLSRPRPEGKGNEYHIQNLPQAARVALIRSAGLTDAVRVKEKPEGLSTTDLRLAARLEVMTVLDRFRKEAGCPRTEAYDVFASVYEDGDAVNLPVWVREIVPTVSPRSLRRWQKARKDAHLSRLGRSQNNKKGRGVLDIAEDGEVARYIGALIINNPHLPTGRMRDMVRTQFGNHLQCPDRIAPLPNVRTFIRFIDRWKTQNAAMLERETNPDGYKNNYMFALGKADAQVFGLNQVWEIDASPADVMLTDGRHSIYVIIDIWSRRMMASVTKTPKTEASLLLVRRACAEWGVPEILKTDNGSDFVSHRFVRALESVGIRQEVCPPFSPEKKPFVERAIGTMQRDLMTRLPGFVGHSVADRKKIEARKAFSARLGGDEKELLSVSLSADELQKQMDDWCRNEYALRVHGGIGTKPALKAASWTGTVRRIDDIRALDLLLAPLAGSDGLRTVTKKGIKINNHYYAGAGMEDYARRQVLVRCDPDDLGVVYLFDIDTEGFICEAHNLDLAGVDRQAMAAAAKALQKEHEKLMKQEVAAYKRSLTPEKIAGELQRQAAEDAAGVSFMPHRSEEHNSAGLDAASDALRRDDPAPRRDEEQEKRLEVNRQEMADHTPYVSDEDRWYAKWKRLDIKVNNSAELSEEEQRFYYIWAPQQSWFQARRDIEQMRQEKGCADNH